MYSLQLTSEFESWLNGLSDKKSQLRVVARLRQAEGGNLGDWKAVGGQVSEMRLHAGPGYRLYFTRKGNVLIIMLAGGSKSTQSRDIARAQRILLELEAEA
jgi:putative addiction module killer protein